MQEILNKLEDALTTAEAKIMEYTGLVAKNKRVADELTDLNKILNEKESSLTARETAVAAIENLVALEKQTRDQKADAEKKEQEVRNLASAFAEYETKARTDLANQSLELQRREQSLKDREDSVAKKEKNIEAAVLERVKAVLGDKANAQ